MHHYDDYFIDEDSEPFVRDYFSFAILSPAEVEYFLKELGFSRIQTFNSYDSRKPTKCDTAKIIVTAQK